MKWPKLIILMILGVFGYGILYGIGGAILLKGSDLVFLNILSSLLYTFALLFIYRRCRIAYEDSVHEEINKGDIIKGAIVGFFLAVLIWTLFYCIMLLFHLAAVEYNTINLSQLSKGLCFCLFVAVGEEIICRGTIFRLLDLKTNFYVASIISSIAFGFLHLPNVGANALSCICVALGSGLILSLLTKYYNSILPAIAFHWIWNFIEGYIGGNLVSGEQFENSLFQTEYVCNDLLSGGDFGPEQSVIIVVFGFALSLTLCFKLYRKLSD